jgi:heterodisulfide reductase subunit A
VATGAREERPDLYGLGKRTDVVTEMDLERMLKEDDPALAEAKAVGFVLCAGSLDESHPYCSRTCCQQCVKNASAKRADPNRLVYVWFKEMRTSVSRGVLRQCASRCHHALRQRHPPQVSASSSVSVSAGPYLGATSPAARPAGAGHAVHPSDGASELSKLLKVPLTADGFYLEAHVKLRPVDFGSEGIFLCGAAHYPKSIEETISQAYAAAGRAASILAKSVLKAGGVVAEVDTEKCAACLTCASARRPIIDPRPKGQDRGGRLPGLRCAVSEARQGDHPATTPTRRSSPGRGARWGDWMADADAARRAEAGAADEAPKKPVDPDFEPEIIVFACHYCAYAAADLAGSMRLQYPSTIRMVKLPCTGKLEVIHLLRALEAGADGVYAAGCLEGECHYLKGNLWARKRVDYVKTLLAELGIEPERVEMYNMSSAMGAKFAEVATEFTSASGARPQPSNVRAGCTPPRAKRSAAGHAR